MQAKGSVHKHLKRRIHYRFRFLRLGTHSDIGRTTSVRFMSHQVVEYSVVLAFIRTTVGEQRNVFGRSGVKRRSYGKKPYDIFPYDRCRCVCSKHLRSSVYGFT
jgi:hypothetical protein